MMKYLWLITTVIMIGATWYITREFYRGPTPVQPVVTPVVSLPIQRPPGLSFELTKDALWHYDNDPVRINWRTLAQTSHAVRVGIQGSLYERNFSQEATIPIASRGNWQLALGIGLGVAATIAVGYVAVKLTK